MPSISQLIGRGIGFAPGSTKYIPTHGLASGAPVVVPPTPEPGPVIPGLPPPKLYLPSSVDADIEQAFVTRFATFADSTLASLGGRLYARRLPARLALPYAQIKSERLNPAEFQAAIEEHDPYHHQRKVTLSVLGYGKQAVGDLMEALKGTYAFRTFDVPNSDLRVCWFAGECLKPDKSRTGTKVWRGEITFHVWLVRLTPMRTRR